MQLDWWKKGLLFGVMSLLIFGTLELGARVIHSITVPEPVVPPSIGQLDPHLGWTLVPGIEVHSKRIGYDIAYKINSKGIRDEETPYEKPEGVFRIVIVGDSRTFGYGVPIEKHFTYLLEGYFDQLEVINLGVSGYGIDQELLFLRREGFKYQPDLVIAHVDHYGDHRHMHTERFGKQKPRFLLQEGELVLTNYPIPGLESYFNPSIPQQIRRWLYDHSRAYAIFRDGVLGMLQKKATSEDSQLVKEDNKKNQVNQEFNKALEDTGLAILKAMDQESREHGAQFLLITSMPSLHKTVMEANIHSLDISIPLYNHLFKLPEDLEHINESGNGVLAWELARYLKANQIVD